MTLPSSSGSCPSVPQVASWVEGDPISDVEAMSGVLDRQRDYVVDGSPIVTGVLPVGDAWACTNPSSGRGISFALLHVIHTVEAIADNADDPLAQTLAWDEATTRHLQPWHTSTLASEPQDGRRSDRGIERRAATYRRQNQALHADQRRPHPTTPRSFAGCSR